jgi:hypothetical protein
MRPTTSSIHKRRFSLRESIFFIEKSLNFKKANFALFVKYWWKPILSSKILVLAKSQRFISQTIK